MKTLLREAGHLVRLATLGALLLILFLLVRRAVVPPSFGKYGHYRAASLEEIAARPASFAGREACEACHDDIATMKREARHARLGCEACHGALAAHAEDPSSNKATKPDTATLCVRCHEADSAKPKWFPQVVSSEHMGDVPCGSCHNPHKPKV
ncbi:MAG TPA: multiheme c-type cytochrome [Bryobacteraceae bacterium]|nr:multiheme c-type cytochrome [Bryobacteraceae bacterium]